MSALKESATSVVRILLFVVVAKFSIKKLLTGEIQNYGSDLKMLLFFIGVLTNRRRIFAARCIVCKCAKCYDNSVFRSFSPLHFIHCVDISFGF